MSKKYQIIILKPIYIPVINVQGPISTPFTISENQYLELSKRGYPINVVNIIDEGKSLKKSKNVEKKVNDIKKKNIDKSRTEKEILDANEDVYSDEKELIISNKKEKEIKEEVTEEIKEEKIEEEVAEESLEDEINELEEANEEIKEEIEEEEEEKPKKKKKKKSSR